MNTGVQKVAPTS